MSPEPEVRPMSFVGATLRPWGPDGPTMEEWVHLTYSPEPLVPEPVVGYHGITPTKEGAPMSIQIKTTEGILTLSNATDVRTTGILVVRGHKGMTLGFIAPLPAGGWVVMDDLASMEAYLDANTNLRDRNDVTMEQAAALTAWRH